MDSTLLIQLDLRHAVIPYRSLSAFTTELLNTSALDKLKLQSNENMKRTLFLAYELVQLMSLLKSHRIPAMPSKGPVPAASIVGNLGLRHFVDLGIWFTRRIRSCKRSFSVIGPPAHGRTRLGISICKFSSPSRSIFIGQSPSDLPMFNRLSWIMGRIEEFETSGHTVPNLARTSQRVSCKVRRRFGSTTDTRYSCSMRPNCAARR